MVSSTALKALALSLFTLAVKAAPPAGGPPPGYSVGMSTQDMEPINQQSICTTNCPSKSFLKSTWGPAKGLPPGVYAGAINPQMGGGSTDCSPCGSCYSVITTHEPYCNPSPYDPKCGAPSGKLHQGGPTEIKVLITNHCTDCGNVPGHIDINHAPDTWDNPRIYWKKIGDASACLGSS